MSPERIVLCLAAFLATLMLVKLMLRRQSQLLELLRVYSNSQLEWSRKKARAALIARRAALQKSEDDGLSELTQMIGTVNAQETPN